MLPLLSTYTALLHAWLAREPAWLWWALALVTLTGLGLRCLNIGESLWLDELHTGWVVRDAWSDIAPRAQIGNQSPAWFYAVKLATTLLGSSEFSLRLLSLVAGVALLPSIYLATRLLLQSGAAHNRFTLRVGGLFAATLVAVDPNCIFYATEARPYACVQLLALWQLMLFITTLRQPSTWSRLGCFVLTAGMFHLHYTALGVVGGELVLLTAYYLTTRVRVPYRPWRAMFDLQITLMLCLPGLPQLWQVFQRRGMWTSIGSNTDWATVLEMFPPWIAICAAACALLARLLAWGLKSTAQSQLPWRAGFVVLLWALVPLLGAWGLAYFELAPIFLRRYLIGVAAAPMLLAGLAIAVIPWRQVAIVAVCALATLATYQSHVIEQIRTDGRAVGDRNEDWRGAISSLNEQWTSQKSLVIVDAGLIEELYWENLDFENVFMMTREREEYLTFPLRSLYPCDIPAERIATSARLEKKTLWDVAWELRGQQDEDGSQHPDQVRQQNELLVIQRGNGRFKNVHLITPGIIFLEELNADVAENFGTIQVLPADWGGNISPTNE